MCYVYMYFFSLICLNMTELATVCLFLFWQVIRAVLVVNNINSDVNCGKFSHAQTGIMVHSVRVE